MRDIAVVKYLSRRAEPEARSLSALPGRTYGNAIVIPSYGEEDSLFRALESVPPGPLGPGLAIVVVNASPESPDWVHAANDRTLRRLRTFRLGRGVGELLIVDRASAGRRLPPRQGVGLARKIGADVALALRATGRLRSRFLHGTDADSILPTDYFQQSARREQETEPVALLYPFVHDASSERLREAAACYEISLRYYVAGLAFAGSPYAFQTIGSTVAVDARAYAAVEGVPRRTAAEDFYLLNKLAKVGSIVRLSGAPLRLEARVSERVPFGTGRAMREASAEGAGSRELYHPEIFVDLRCWLQVIEAFAVSAGERDPRELLASAAGDPARLARLEGALASLRALEAAARFPGRSRSPGTLRRHLHTWFDAFRTLKLIHALRDRALPCLPWEEALLCAAFVRPPSGAARFRSGEWLAHVKSLDRDGSTENAA